MSESSSPGCSSDNYHSVSNRRAEKPGIRARSSSRVRFNPEVEVQTPSTCGASGVSGVKCEACSMNPEESHVPKYGATVGREPLKTQDGGQSTLREIDANAEREAQRRARSQQVYDAMFGSSTLGGGAAGVKNRSFKAAGSPHGGPSQPYGYGQSSGHGNGGLQPDFAYYQEQSEHGQYTVSGYETYYDDPNGSFDGQGYGGYPNNGGYGRDPHSHRYEAQGYDAYGNGPAFAGPYEPAWTEAELRRRHDHRANMASSSFSNAQ